MANYIDNKKFESLIQIYASGDRAVQDELFELFDLLIENIISGFNFNVEKDDAKQECLLLILKVLKNFKRENGAAFNYFTTIILNNLRLIFTKRKKYLEKIESYKEVRYGVYTPSSVDIDPL
jgi:DNA-directed RNA polymerase specialized sigma subunit